MSKEKLEHGRHNEKVFTFLQKDINFIDWMITTSFYSSIHIVDYKIFPLEVNDLKTGKKRNFKTLDEYFNYYKYSSGAISKSRHDLRKDLVGTKCSSISSDFKWLKDMCFTARYINYKFDNAELYKARAGASLNSIKSFCTK